MDMEDTTITITTTHSGRAFADFSVWRLAMAFDTNLTEAHGVSWAIPAGKDTLTLEQEEKLTDKAAQFTGYETTICELR